LRQNDNNLLLAGAIASALLALVCDFAIGQLEKSYAIGERTSAVRKIAGFALAGALIVFAISSFVASIGSTKQTIVIGSKDFTESVILAEILAQSLERDGISVKRQFELGGNIPHKSLLSGQIDVYPEYTGTAYTTFLEHPPITDPQTVYDQTKTEYLEKFDLDLSPPAWALQTTSRSWSAATSHAKKD
jgi:osmoprotectant transport system permease protein